VVFRGGGGNRGEDIESRKGQGGRGKREGGGEGGGEEGEEA
jgi:hypothetical protein